MKQVDVKLTDLSGAVAFVGSMLSSDTRTGLPAGQTVSARLVEKIVRPTFKAAQAEWGLTSNDKELIEKLAHKTPFEVLLQHHPDPKAACDHLADLYRGGTLNPLHEALVSAIKGGHIAHIVTTNYDSCIEEALRVHLSPKVVVDEARAKTIDWSAPSIPPIVYKIHGCAHSKWTMVFNLPQEGALPPWKRELLRNLVDGRDVVVMGYSGLDFDICPILFGLGYSRLLWLFAEKLDFKAAIAGSSPNVRSVHRQEQRFDRVFGILGGFDAIFDGLVLDKNYSFIRSTAATNIADRLFEAEASDPYPYQYWRGALLNTIACRLGSEAILRAMSVTDRERPASVKLWSDTLERAGRYNDAVRELKRLERIYAASGLHEDALEALFLIAGRRYTGWYLFRFLIARRRYASRVSEYKSAGTIFDEQLAAARETYLAALFLKILGKLPFARKMLSLIPIRRLSPAEIRSAAEFHYRRGEWQEVRLLQAVGDDLQIHVTVADPHGSTTDADLLLSAVDAFSHANNVVGLSSAYRRSQEKTAERCEELLEALLAFGHSAEFWKAFESFAPHIGRRKRQLYKGFALSELARCQYPYFIKRLRLLRLRFLIAFARG